METITINGVNYERIPRSAPNLKGKSVSLSLLLASMPNFEYSRYGGGGPPRSKPLPVDDIVKEYELIQRKKSKLSRNERDRVVVAFKRKYREVK